MEDDFEKALAETSEWFRREQRYAERAKPKSRHRKRIMKALEGTQTGER